MSTCTFHYIANEQIFPEDLSSGWKDYPVDKKTFFRIALFAFWKLPQKRFFKKVS